MRLCQDDGEYRRLTFSHLLLSVEGRPSNKWILRVVLAAGTRLGPYEIIEPIGKGGMGEVHRARDTKLGREVAIKVLPDELASDEERVARFEREAKLLASLNHPNIASIYGFESGALVLDEGGGETLADILQLDLDGSSEPQPFVVTDNTERLPSISPIDLS